MNSRKISVKKVQYFWKHEQMLKEGTEEDGFIKRTNCGSYRRR